MIELKGKVAERFENEREKAEKSPKTDVSENVEIVRQIVSETKGEVCMNKEELAKQYADKEVAKKGQYIDCVFDVRKELTTFDGYDIEQAFEDGYDKAVELACEFIKERIVFDDNAWYVEGEITLKDKVIEDFKKVMEEKV